MGSAAAARPPIAPVPLQPPTLGERIALWSWGAAQLARHGKPQAAFVHEGGLGDVLMLNQVLRELRQRGDRRNLWVLSNFPALLAANPDCDHALPITHRAERLLRRLRVAVQDLNYARHDFATDRDAAPSRHVLAEMARLAGVTGEIELRPHYPLSESARGQGAGFADAVCIQATTANARYPIRTKEWGPENFTAVSRRLAAAGVRLVQLGLAADPALAGAEDWRGKLSLEEIAAALSHARLFVGLVGGLMHLARAVDCPAVIVYGGREQPWQSGYSANVNLTRSPACSPCWLWSRCEHRFVCLAEISPEEVSDAATARLGQPRGPLPVDRAVLA